MKNIEILFLITKQTDTLIEQTETKTQGTLEFKLTKYLETFAFFTPMNLFEEGKGLKG